MITLRPYQSEAVDAVFAAWGRGVPGGLLIEVPTGGGKSPILGELSRRLVAEYSARVAVVTHRAELIDQDAKAIRSVWPTAPCGIYSASLGLREVRDITVCGVQSVYRKAHILGPVEVLIIDEAHLVSPNDGTQYQRLIEKLREINPDLRVLGLTATPYRLGQGSLTEGQDSLFSSVCYRVDVARLIADGYLSPLVSARASTDVDLQGVRVQGGEYAITDLELAYNVQEITDAVADDVVRVLQGEDLYSRRQGALLYGCTVAHAESLAAAVVARGASCEVVHGEMDKRRRKQILDAFKAKEIASLSSCDILTTGFDAPHVDLIALVRATCSPSLYVQILGRGMRIAPGKRDCAVLDYGGNVARHGPITDVKKPPRPSPRGGEAPTKQCPTCLAVVHTAVRVCPYCDTQLADEVQERKANKSASRLDPMSGAAKTRTTHEIARCEFSVRESMKTGIPMLVVEYFAEDPKLAISRSVCEEFVCLEHDGYALSKAGKWWAEHKVPGHAYAPKTANKACAILDEVGLPIVEITTEPDGRYTRVVGFKLDESGWKKPGEWDAEKMKREEDGETVTFSEREPLFDVYFDGDDLPF